MQSQLRVFIPKVSPGATTALLKNSLLSHVSQDEGAVISQISDIPNRDGHATDEEKLASTSCSQKSAGAEVKGEPGEATEHPRLYCKP